MRSQGDADLQHADFLRFQLEEIDRIGPEPGEDERLEQEHRRLAHADKLVGATQLAEALLHDEHARSKLVVQRIVFRNRLEPPGLLQGSGSGASGR